MAYFICIISHAAAEKISCVLSRKVWDAVSGDEVLTLAHKHIVKTVSFTQVGALSECGTSVLRNRNMTLIFVCFYSLNLLYPSASSQDSSCLLTGGNDKLLRLYDLSNPDAGT